MRRPLALALLGLTVLVPAAGRATVARAATPCQAGDTMVTMPSVSYSPSSVTVMPNTWVCWTNDDAVNHSATSDTSGVFDTGILTSGQSNRIFFSSLGSFPYHCMVHGLLMRGTVNVSNTPPPPPPPAPPPPSPPGVPAAKSSCKVPGLVGRTLPQSRRLLAAKHCRLGRVGKAFSKPKLKGRVLSQRPKPGTRLALNARVNVVLGRGPRR